LLPSKPKNGSDIPGLWNDDFLASHSCVFMPSFEEIGAGWQVGNSKHSSLIGDGEVGMIENMNVR